MEIYRDAFDERIAALLSLPGKVDMMHDDSVSLAESRKVFREGGGLYASRSRAMRFGSCMRVRRSSGQSCRDGHDDSGGGLPLACGRAVSRRDAAGEPGGREGPVPMAGAEPVNRSTQGPQTEGGVSRVWAERSAAHGVSCRRGALTAPACDRAIHGAGRRLRPFREASLRGHAAALRRPGLRACC